MCQISDIGRPADMRRLLNAVAAQMASLAVPAALAGRLQIPASTLKRYLDLLELLFVVRRIPAWSTNLTTWAVSRENAERDCMDAISFALQGDPNDYDSDRDAVTLDVSVAPAAA